MATDPVVCAHANTVRIRTPEYLPTLNNGRTIRPIPRATALMIPPPRIYRCVDCDLRGELTTTRKDTP